MKAIVVNNLSKVFDGNKKAVDNISFSLETGEVFGFLGPNGAGKTTAVKLLNGMLSPTEGSCHVFDIDSYANPEQVHAISGVVTEHAQMYDNLTGLQNLIFYGNLFGMSDTDSRNRALSLLETVDLTDAADQKLETYSTGMRQRLSLARAMIHRPRILFLDEPTSGLDPESVLSVNNMIKSLAQNEGTTIFLCTHQLRYAQEICNSYGLIDEGELFAVGSIETLRGLASSGMTVHIKADHFPAELTATQTGELTYEVDVQSEEEIPSLVKNIVDKGANIYHVSAHELSLEEIYFSLLNKRTKNKGEA